MKKILLVVIVFVITNTITAQVSKETNVANAAAPVVNKQHKIVFQVTSEDTLIHNSLMKQLKNIITIAPNSTIEVVCHGNGLYMLVKEKTLVKEQIKSFAQKGVRFVACEFAMAAHKITKEQLVDEAGTVKSGVLEIVEKQEEGWSYIKMGF